MKKEPFLCPGCPILLAEGKDNLLITEASTGTRTKREPVQIERRSELENERIMGIPIPRRVVILYAREIISGGKVGDRIRIPVNSGLLPRLLPGLLTERNSAKGRIELCNGPKMIVVEGEEVRHCPAISRIEPTRRPAQ